MEKETKSRELSNSVKATQPGGASGKEHTCQCRRHRSISDQEDPLKKGMATHSSILAWKIPWTEVSYNPRHHKELDMTEVTEQACMYNFGSGD